MNKGNSIRYTLNKIVKEARMRWQPGGTWKRTSYVSPLELGQVKYHFLDTKNPDKHVGQSAMTRALANLHVDKGDPNNPKAAIIGHPFAGDLKHLHQLAKHHERRMMDAQMHLNKDPLAIKGRFKNDAHARSSFNKWSNHLHTLHSDVMRGLLDAQAKGHPLPEGFEGLTPQHVENHAKIKGIDISQPFDSKSFNEKVRGFGRHNTLDGSINHPLYQGWKTPPAPPTNPTPQVESNTMSKSQRIRAIFESKLAEAKDVVGSAENIVKLSELPHSEEDKELRAAWKKTAQKTMLQDIKDREAAAKAKLSGEVAAEVGRMKGQPQNSSTNYYKAGLKALFENNYLRLHPVGKPGDQAIHDTLRAHFDSLDPKIGADLHNQMDRHIKMYHYVRETPGESGAHAELRRFEHEHLRNAAQTGSQGVTPNDVRQHLHMFNTDDPSDRLAHTAIKDSFYRPKESKSRIRAGLRDMFEAVLDEARGIGSQANKERQGKLKRRFDALDKVARKQRGTIVSKGGVTYIGNRPVRTRGEEDVSKKRARFALKLEPEIDDRDPNPDPA